MVKHNLILKFHKYNGLSCFTVCDCISVPLFFSHAHAILDSEPAILLSEQKYIVFKKGFNTVSGGRNKPVPQLLCVKGNACGTRYEPESVMCENIGVDYATGDPDWANRRDLRRLQTQNRPIRFERLVLIRIHIGRWKRIGQVHVDANNG